MCVFGPATDTHYFCCICYGGEEEASQDWEKNIHKNYNKHFTYNLCFLMDQAKCDSYINERASRRNVKE